ncbi:MAG: type I restriction enzyme endonuclease domain-containing protein [Pseudonocardiales bacterium]
MRTDWTMRDDVRAKLRSSIKRLLVKHGYPPDKQPRRDQTCVGADGIDSPAIRSGPHLSRAHESDRSLPGDHQTQSLGKWRVSVPSLVSSGSLNA